MMVGTPLPERLPSAQAFRNVPECHLMTSSSSHTKPRAERCSADLPVFLTDFSAVRPRLLIY